MLDSNGFIIPKSERKNRSLSSFVRVAPMILKQPAFLTDEEVMNIPRGDVFVFDTECYPNFWYAAFKHIKSGKYIDFEQSADRQLESTKLLWMLWSFTVVGFNSINYDMPMMTLAIQGVSNQVLKDASDFIIKSGIAYGTKKVTPFDFEKKYNVKVQRFNHIDLFNVCPVNGGVTATPASLKLYAARLQAPRLQDLPYDPARHLTADEGQTTRLYCCNDLDNTELLLAELQSEIDLRIELGQQYKIDLRSKSDAQIAENIVNIELEKILGKYPSKPKDQDGFPLHYKAPSFIQFQTDACRNVLAEFEAADFHLDALGSPVMPVSIDKLKLKLGSATYNFGMGGIHSTEKKIAHIATDDIEISDNDVESFYPRIALICFLFPKHLGEAFVTVYREIIERRLFAKGESNNQKKSRNHAESKRWKKISDSLKIVINGLFGKLGNRYSTVYAPELMLQVTITGQLALLMIIEAMHLIGVEVIQANTDGVVLKYHKSKRGEVRHWISMWETFTGFKTEETQYKAIYSRDVNSYCAVKYEGEPEARFLDERLGVKTKGAYCERGSALNSILSRNPTTQIAIDAAITFLANKTPIERTISECKDFKRFTSIKNVRGGGEKNGLYLGKVVRWYYPKNEAGQISYVSSGNKVGTTDGARPVMDLPEQFPDDIDYDWYVKEAETLLKNCGAMKSGLANLF